MDGRMDESINLLTIAVAAVRKKLMFTSSLRRAAEYEWTEYETKIYQYTRIKCSIQRKAKTKLDFAPVMVGLTFLLKSQPACDFSLFNGIPCITRLTFTLERPRKRFHLYVRIIREKAWAVGDWDRNFFRVRPRSMFIGLCFCSRWASPETASKLAFLLCLHHIGLVYIRIL